jgi:hypothetical protein
LFGTLLKSCIAIFIGFDAGLDHNQGISFSINLSNSFLTFNSESADLSVDSIAFRYLSLTNSYVLFSVSSLFNDCGGCILLNSHLIFLIFALYLNLETTHSNFSDSCFIVLFILFIFCMLVFFGFIIHFV